MDFFGDMMNKAKEAINVASKKTGEVVNTQKQKFDVASLESKREKDFAVLGEIYYNKIKDGEVDDESISELLLSIKEKSEKIDNLKAEINSAKNKRICPKCGAAIDLFSNYCNACGEKLFYDSEEDKTEE
ncbi:MAG: zinc ribbon domain-containing protein [Acutalibacteraceae bacterium]|nr:zinc ribbon domain-containing protein [Acutalibacteraceae bacterium]